MRTKFVVLLCLLFFANLCKSNTPVDDTAAAVVNPNIYCPDDFSIDCGWEWGQYEYGNLVSTNTGAATSFNRHVKATINDLTNGCGIGVIEVEWCTKPIGNENPACCTQEVLITDGGSPWNPNDIDFQNDISLGCVDEVNAPQKPQWGEGLCDLIAWTSEDLELYFEEDACYKVIRTYTVVNWCTDETVTHNTYIKVIDQVPPVIICTDKIFAITNTDCNIGVSLTKSASDGDSNCSSAWLEWKAEVDLWGDGTIDYTWSFAEGADENFREDRDDDMDRVYYLPKTLDVTLNIPELIDNSCNNHKVKWSVNDGCNNFSSCTETFMVVDKKAPTPYCISVSSAVMVNGEVELWASDFDLGATDNCTEQDHLLFSFSGTDYNPNRLFTCADDPDGDGVIQLPVYVWDDGCTPNVEFCNVTLTLSNCGAGGVPILGGIATEEGQEVTNVDVTIDSDGVINYPMTYQTDDQGEYAFSHNTLALDYSVTGSRTDDYMNGVSTLDLILLIKHIIGEQVLDSPYKMIAADIDNSGHISAIDLVELRKLILGVYDELPNTEAWRFIDAGQALTIANPWGFSDTIVLNNVTADLLSENFVAIKTGDLNGSVMANATSVNTENRSSTTLLLEVKDREVKAGERVAIDVMSSNYNDIIGYQFTLNVEGLEITEVEGAKLAVTKGNVAIDKDVMTMSYHANNVQSAAKNEVLFTIHVLAKQAGLISKMLDINSSVTKAEAYVTEKLAIADVQLSARTKGEVELVAGYKLFQNEPNPFNEVTQVGFRLPSASSATITVYDVTGKVIKRVTRDYEKGYNIVEIRKSEIATAAGVFYYQLNSGDFSATRKMVVIE